MATVRTEAGSSRYDKPIGTPLDDTGSEEQAAPVRAQISSLRLRSLRSMIMSKILIGDEASAAALTEKFRAEYTEFSQGKTRDEVTQALNSGS